MTEAAAVTASGTAQRGRGLSLRFGALVTALSVVVIAVGLGIVGSSLWVSNDFKDTSEDQATLMQAMRNQVTADMYHDTLRGVVFRAMYALVKNDAAMVKDAQAEIQEYGKAFKDVLAALKPLDLPAEVRSALNDLNAPLDDYIAGADKLIDKALAGDLDGASAELGPFDEKFKALEDKMSATSDSIQAFNDQLTARAVSVSQSADITN